MKTHNHNVYLPMNRSQKCSQLNNSKGISLAGAVVGMAMLSIVVSVIASLMADSFNIMNRSTSTSVIESSHLSALFFLKNPKNFVDPTATNISHSGLLPTGVRDCLLAQGTGCNATGSSGGGWQPVSAMGASVIVQRQVPNCTVGTGGAVSCSGGTTTLQIQQDNLNGYLDRNGSPCNWTGSTTTNCWYERKAEYQVRDCNNDSCEWVDVRLETRPLNNSNMPPFNPNMVNEAAMATRKTSFGFNKYALMGGKTINFSCAGNSFATQIDYKTHKALCQGLNTTVITNVDCTLSGGNKKLNSFGSPGVCQNMPNSTCGNGYATLTLGGNSGGVACR